MAVSGPIVTATISSTSISPPSLTCIAASMAWVSYGLRLRSPLRSMRPVCGLIRFSTAASGTSFTRTQIFNGSLLWDGTCDQNNRLTDQSIACGCGRSGGGDGAADEVHDRLGARSGREDLRDAQPFELRDVVAGDRPPDRDEDVVDALLGEQLHD